ncbi:MAG: prepilin peptidase [Phycisphaerales bacterium]|nr:prepilin peptidase [Phycisphaerales bacterium]
MNGYHLAMCGPLFVLLIVAAVGDARTRRIPNVLTVCLAVMGLAQSFLPTHTVGPMQSLGGLGLGFGLTFILFAMGALGGGDVKLMAGVGAWVGVWPVAMIFAGSAVVGMVSVLMQSAKQGRMRVLFRNSAVLALNLVHIGDVGVEHVSQTGQESRSVDRPLPYAVPVLLATVGVLLLG